MKDCAVLLLLVNYQFCTPALFLLASTLTAMGTRAQLLRHHGSVKHRRLNLNQKHWLVEWKKQTLADLENISYVFISMAQIFKAREFVLKTAWFWNYLFIYKIALSPEMQSFPI